MIVLPHATTGIASDLLIGGMTMHSRFQIPLNLHKDSIINMKKTSLRGKQIIDADLIIID
jgi:PIF1-like helicase